MSKVSSNEIGAKRFKLDPLVFGQRLRHLRTARGLTLRQLGQRVGKQAPYLSQLENGKRDPGLSLVSALARALRVTPDELLAAEPPSHRAELEIGLQRAQKDPLWYREMGLPPLSPSARIPTNMLEAIVRLFEELKGRGQVRAETPEGARRANTALRREMQEGNNYFPDIEQLAANTLEAIDYTDGPVSRRALVELANHLGFTFHLVQDLPRSVRSLTDLRYNRIYIPQRNQLGTRLARSVVIQTLGHFVLGHEDPEDFGQFLRQRVEANYFAGAILVPERAVVPLLLEAGRNGEIAVEDLEEHFYVSYEMAAHRFTNLATHHLDIPVHFVRSDENGVIWKAYENDGIPFPTDPEGAIEGQLLCRRWGPRNAFSSEDRFSTHYQVTETPAGAYWSSTYIEASSEPLHAVTLGARFEHARVFRGSDTKVRATSRCPDGPCCRRPPADLSARWDGKAWPSPRPQSHILAALPAGTFPGVELADVYEFLDRRAET